MRLFDHSGMAMELTLKTMHYRQLYRETGSEMYKILADGYFELAEDCGPSSIFKPVKKLVEGKSYFIGADGKIKSVGLEEK